MKATFTGEDGWPWWASSRPGSSLTRFWRPSTSTVREREKALILEAVVSLAKYRRSLRYKHERIEDIDAVVLPVGTPGKYVILHKVEGREEHNFV
jgi:hypothetical protein